MMTSRSSSVTLDNVDDYLAPSQACVNPAFQPTTKLGDTNDGVAKESSANAVVPRRRRKIVRKKPISLETEPATNGVVGASASLSNPVEEETKPKKAVKASMADCLACSGCVTTAETVMMEERHSLKSLRNRLSLGEYKPRIVTISPNSWADMRRHWKLSPEDETMANKKPFHDDQFYFSRFTNLLSKILGVKIVVDGNIPLQWTWIDEAEEFCQVYRKNQEKRIEMVPNDSSPLPSVAIDSSKTMYYKSDGSSEIKDTTIHRPTPNLPLISGSCPALVCLVEKTLTKLVPHLSQSISPMSLVGMILKGRDDTDDGVDNQNTPTTNNKWDHWAIMPCHDKKLEASRKDFALDSKEQVVDLVISTQECVELVEEWIASQQQQQTAYSFDELPANRLVANYLATIPPSDVCTSVLEPEDLLQQSHSCTIEQPSAPLLVTTPRIGTSTSSSGVGIAFSSGGHANFMFTFAAKKLFGCHWDSSKINDGVNWKAASLAAKNAKSARLGKLLKQHYYEAKLYHHPDGTYGNAPVLSENGEELSTVVLYFAVAHGMQTMQRALKQVSERHTGRILHYLEAMACPHGCVNGGGSVRSPSTKSSTTLIRETPTETRQRVRSTLSYLQVPRGIPTAPLESQKLSSLPRTVYHVVPPMNYTTGAVAGEKVENMVW